MKFKNLDAENSANSTRIKNFAKSANSISSANSTNARNSINFARSAEATVPAKAKDASQSFELQNGDILRARYKDYRVSGLWNQSRGMKLGDTRSGLRRVIDFIAAGATNRSASRRRARADAARRSHRRLLRQRSKLHRIFAAA